MMGFELVAQIALAGVTCAGVGACIASNVVTPFLGYIQMYFGPLAALVYALWKFVHDRTESIRHIILEGVGALALIEVLCALAQAVSGATGL